MANLIELRQVSKIYGTSVKTKVLHEVDLNIAQGSFNGIIGASGSGKSTLLNLIGTLDKPSNGQVLIDGIETSKMKANALAKLRNQTIGFVFQFHYLLPEFTALENVLMPYYIKGKKIDKKLNDRAEELLELVGLTKVKNNLAGNMSGGQQQRTAIARSLINQPKLILADEPTGNLDSETTEQVYELLREIHKTYNTTFVIITHDRRIAEKTDRIIEIKDGRIFSDFSKIF
ncbi:MAG: lipoprotein ABC transporter ATP-binding protein LolD [Clostridiales bacterium 38-18]|nr:MAG: lipoprotein ABC transporter ATP-binding protein LolD [Clostridiales bacterium 38-18]